MKIYITLLALSLLLFTGCGSQKRVVVTQKAAPTWYDNPPQNSSNILYEVGQGYTKKEAIDNALSMMISTLSVSIESKYKSKSVESQGTVENYQKTVSNEIQSEVKKIRISNYEVLKSEEFGFKDYRVLVKSDKTKIFNSLKQELDQKFAFIDKRSLSIKKQNALKQISFYKEAKESVKDVPNTLVVMSGLQGNFDAKGYLSKVSQVNTKYESLLDTISFSIKANTQAQNLQDSIRDGLSVRQLPIKNAKGPGHFEITITSKIQKANAYGFTLARSAIAIKVKDYNGAIIGSNKLNIVGQSTQGYAIAKENVAIKLQNMIEKEGIEKVLGLEL
ncbi:MAG: LPP20 family lipoprotein [Campylobacterota bacterium]|nr:LPP20 family lipoprotein [Campylobacterota bacterium]